MAASPTSDLATRLQAIVQLQRQGELDDAERQLQPLLDRFPDLAAVRKAAATLALARGRHEDAIAHMREAVGHPPQPGPRLEYACLLAHTGRLREALPEFEAVAAARPDLADAWYFLGRTRQQLGRHASALPALRRARALAPADPRVLPALAEAEFKAGFPVDALPLWRELATQRPDDTDTLLKLGETLTRLGNDDAAAAWFRSAIGRQPDSPDLWMALGQAEEDRGERAAAHTAYERALALRPDWPHPLAGLLGLARGDAPEERVGQARRLLAGDLDDAGRALLGYALGKVMDARGRWPEAMADWDAANAARRRATGDFDADAHRRRGERTMAAFDATRFAAPRRGGSDDPRPVFIVGMPRSGTTLTEQIIAAHPAAFGAGELAELSLIADALPAIDGGVAGWPPDPARLAPGALDWAVARYLDAATRHAPPDARRIVDKAPLNYHRLGLAALMFPNARVIWCRRDPRDVAISIYGENFALEERSATTLAGIGATINLQEAMMRHWQRVLPLPILELRYETLVDDFEAQVRRLLAFAGLDWDPACLGFHASERAVQTPSRWQVRQPVHSRSVGRWRHYAFALGPLLDVLETPPPP